MQIQVTEVDSCKLAIEYQAGSEEILNKRSEVINSFRKAPVPGNRPGKASIEAIKMHYKDQINDSLKRALAEDAYHNTLFEKKFKPHGQPKFNSMSLVDGKFSCQFDLYTKPDFELAPFKGLEIPKPHSEFTASELSEKMMQDLRVRVGEVSPFSDTDFVQSGDSVLIDYQGTINGEVVPSLSAEGEMIVIGNSQMVSFDTNLLGMFLGETREFDLTIPKGALPSISEKVAHFKVTLNMGSKTVPCALNEKLARAVGKETFDEVKKEIDSHALVKVEQLAQNAIRQAVSARLVNDNEIKVPNWMSLSEAQYLVHGAKLEWDKITDLDKEEYLSMAEKNVKLALILDRIREDPEAQLSDEETFNAIKQNMLKDLAKGNHKISLDEAIKELTRTGYMSILQSRIKDEFTLGVVIKHTKFID